MIEPVPRGDESLYLWSFTQGRHGVPEQEYLLAVASAGRLLRQKDIDNFRRGYSKWEDDQGMVLFDEKKKSIERMNTRSFIDRAYSSLPVHPLKDMPELEDRWVPTVGTRPLWKWSEKRCTLETARNMLNADSVAENMLGTKMIVIDCDGDHAKDELDYDTIRFLGQWITKTHCIMKPKTVSEYGEMPFGQEDLADLPASFHLTFSVDRVVPTMHFPWAHIDIVGNMRGSLRFWKNKQWNEIEPAPMTDEIWRQIREYQRGRRRQWE